MSNRKTKRKNLTKNLTLRIEKKKGDIYGIFFSRKMQESMKRCYVCVRLCGVCVVYYSVRAPSEHQKNLSVNQLIHKLPLPRGVCKIILI